MGNRIADNLRAQYAKDQSSDAIADTLSSILSAINAQNVTLQKYLQTETQLLETIVDEHATQECPSTAGTFSFTLNPQTRQSELIEGITVNLFTPSSVTISNAYVQLGDCYYGMAGVVASPYYPSYTPIRQLVKADDKRTVSVTATGNFPAGTFLSFRLFGKVIPTTLGGILG